MNKQAKKMLFGAAMSEKMGNPNDSDYTNVEAALVKCAGREGANIYYPIDSLVAEFTEYAKKPTNKNKKP